MGSRKLMIVGATLMALLSSTTLVSSTVECSAVTSLVATCYTFITYGSPDPFPGSPCCNAMTNLKVIADTIENRRFACRCLMGLIATYNPNAYAIATLPDFCQSPWASTSIQTQIATCKHINGSNGRTNKEAAFSCKAGEGGSSFGVMNI